MKRVIIYFSDDSSPVEVSILNNQQLKYKKDCLQVNTIDPEGILVIPREKLKYFVCRVEL